MENVVNNFFGFVGNSEILDAAITRRIVRRDTVDGERILVWTASGAPVSTIETLNAVGLFGMCGITMPCTSYGSVMYLTQAQDAREDARILERAALAAWDSSDGMDTALAAVAAIEKHHSAACEEFARAELCTKLFELADAVRHFNSACIARDYMSAGDRAHFMCHTARHAVHALNACATYFEYSSQRRILRGIYATVVDTLQDARSRDFGTGWDAIREGFDPMAFLVAFGESIMDLPVE